MWVTTSQSVWKTNHWATMSSLKEGEVVQQWKGVREFNSWRFWDFNAAHSLIKRICQGNKTLDPPMGIASTAFSRFHLFLSIRALLGAVGIVTGEVKPTMNSSPTPDQRDFSKIELWLNISAKSQRAAAVWAVSQPSNQERKWGFSLTKQDAD